MNDEIIYIIKKWYKADLKKLEDFRKKGSDVRRVKGHINALYQVLILFGVSDKEIQNIQYGELK